MRFRCQDCRRWKLSGGKLCETCASAARGRQAVRLQALQTRLHEELLALHHTNSDTDSAIREIVTRYENMGLKSAGSAETDFRNKRLAAWISEGKLPVVYNSGVMLGAGEVAHLTFDFVSLVQNQITGQSITTQTEGVIYHGLYAGGSTSKIHTHRANVTLGQGRLVFTSHRLVFSSPSAGLNVPWHGVVSMDEALHGISIVTAAGSQVGTAVQLIGVDADVAIAAYRVLRAG